MCVVFSESLKQTIAASNNTTRFRISRTIYFPLDENSVVSHGCCVNLGISRVKALSALGELSQNCAKGIKEMWFFVKHHCVWSVGACEKNRRGRNGFLILFISHPTYNKIFLRDLQEFSPFLVQTDHTRSHQPGQLQRRPSLRCRPDSCPRTLETGSHHRLPHR